MKTPAEIMQIRLAAYGKLCQEPMTQWWRDMFIYKRNGRDVCDLIFGEPPHNRKEA